MKSEQKDIKAVEAATGYSVIHEEKSLRKENSRGKFEVVVV